LRKVDIIILSVCALLVAVSVNMLLLSLTKAEGSRALGSDPINLSRAPIQQDSLRKALPVLHFGKRMVVMSAKATYSIDAQLVSKKRYLHGFMNELAPYDFALVWGDMPLYLKQMKFRQTSRFCLFNMKKNATVTPQYVQNHMSNNHLIPASKNIKKAMKIARKGDLIRIEGHLVDVEASRNGRMIAAWGSSVSREDTGNGACELIYVTLLRIGDTIYE